jgi:ATP-dependent Clp protease ATP-binding subunit ClpC
VRERVVRIVGSGEDVSTSQIPFTPRAKKVLELALREALSLGHNYIGTEHILLGLIAENEGVALRTRPDPDSDREEHEGVAARILRDCDADAEKIRNELIRMLSSPEARAACPGGSHVRELGDIDSCRPVGDRAPATDERRRASARRRPLRDRSR